MTTSVPTPPASARDADVLVVGAGLAGLSTARALIAAGLEVLVLEARDRVGGRTLNHPIGGGDVVELGGQWVGPTQHVVNRWIDELGLERFATHDVGSNLAEFGRLRRYTGAIPRLGPLVLADIAQAQLRLERMLRTVPLDAPWKAPRAERWDAMTFASWISRNVRTGAGRDFLGLLCEAVWAADPGDVSLLHVLFYAASAGGLDRLISTDGGAQQDRILGGSQRIAEAAAATLDGRIVLDAPVRRVVQDDGGATVVTDERTFRAARVVVTVPPALAGRIVYDPPLPGHRDQLTQRMPMGSVVKCHAVYPTPFWRADGLSGQVTSTRGPVKVVFDNSPPHGERGVLLGFLEGRQARELGRRPAAERRQAVLDCFARFFGPAAAAPEQFVERSWAEEEWTRGCYAGYMVPGGWTSYGEALRAPCGRIHWAGSETATVWNGYLDGAISSGERVAQEVLAEARHDRRNTTTDAPVAPPIDARTGA